MVPALLHTHGEKTNIKKLKRVSNNLKQYSPFVLHSYVGCTIFREKKNQQVSQSRLYRNTKNRLIYLRHAGLDPA